MSALRGWGPRGRTLLLVAFVGLLAGLTAPRAVSAQTSPSADLVARGKYVFGATGGCGCHTEKDRPVNSGGRKYDGPFGTVYSSNITPDQQTGIGGWTDEQIITAIRLGRRPNGERLIPVHPYPVFNGMAAEDLRALVAFLRTIPPVNRPNTPKKISVPAVRERVPPGLAGGVRAAGDAAGHRADLGRGARGVPGARGGALRRVPHAARGDSRDRQLPVPGRDPEGTRRATRYRTSRRTRTPASRGPRTRSPTTSRPGTSRMATWPAA